jgi:hypothetical protein
MGLRVPPNQIVESKYTSGNEYMFAKTYKEYKGYYYEVSGKKFAGKEFNVNNPEIIKINNPTNNKLKFNPSTYIYAAISGVQLAGSIITSHMFKPTESDIQKGQVTRYFSKKINGNPIIIKEIDQDTFKTLQSNPLYQTIAILFVFSPGYTNGVPQDLDEKEKEFSGIKAFLGL